MDPQVPKTSHSKKLEYSCSGERRKGVRVAFIELPLLHPCSFVGRWSLSISASTFSHLKLRSPHFHIGLLLKQTKKSPDENSSAFSFFFYYTHFCKAISPNRLHVVCCVIFTWRVNFVHTTWLDKCIARFGEL